MPKRLKTFQKRKGGISMNESDIKWLERLAESFDDMKERLIRIEENVKTVQKVQEEVSLLGTKVTNIETSLTTKVANVESSTKSAHKRLDKMEAADKQKADDIRFLKRTAIAGFISFLFSIIAGVIVAAFKGWI